MDTGDGEDFDALYARMLKATNTSGPVAVVNRRKMAPGIPGIEGTHAGHDVIGKDAAIEYLTLRGQDAAVTYPQRRDQIEAPAKVSYKGSTADQASNRTEFGNIVNGILDQIPADERPNKVLVVDSDLEGSTGLKGIRVAHPEVCINGGVQERGNFSAAAGFGSIPASRASSAPSPPSSR